MTRQGCCVGTTQDAANILDRLEGLSKVFPPQIMEQALLETGGDGAFPQVRKVSLVELGTHVEVALAIGGWHDSKQKLVSQLWDKIPADALLLEDRGFFSYEYWKKLHLRVKLLVRIKGNMILKPIQRLPDGSYLAKIYPSSYARDKDRDGIIVRVIEYTLDDPQRTGHGQKHLLLTNLFDHEL